MLVFLLLTLAGMACAVFAWPGQQSTRTGWFWTCVIVYPIAAAALVVSRRFSVYEGRRLDAQAWNEARKQYITYVFERASVPMFVLESAFFFTTEEADVLADLVGGTLMLKAQPSLAESGTVTARWLQPDDVNHEKWTRGPDAARQMEVLHWVLRKLMDRMLPTLSILTFEVPLTVKLQVSATALLSDVSAVWSDIWTKQGLPPVHVEVIGKQQFSSIESWLDSDDSISRRTVTLLVSVNLNKILSENPPSCSAEAGVALLLAHQDGVDEYSTTPVATLHRPTTGNTDTLSRAMRHALRWGKVQPNSIGTLWLTGIDETSPAAMHRALSETGAMQDRSDAPPEIDIDRTVGHAGVAAPWLSVALAIEHTRKSKVPQLIVIQDDGQFSMAVVAPSALQASSNNEV